MYTVLVRGLFGAVVVAALACAGATAQRGAPPLVDVGERDPDLMLDIRYATDDNFLDRALYEEARCLLVPDAADRLLAAEGRLRAQGYRLVVWDCYRPRSVQYAMWEIKPDPTYVADPEEGSRHNRGAAVDVGLATIEGEPVPLPTDHDDFTPKAHRDATDLPPEAIANRERLEAAMRAEGWSGLESEWWHFDAPGWKRYPLRDVPLTEAGR
ncbi:MAG: M15 family metallopeptidase [Gemmatimonadota bacterium]|nr:M15 family metallopeptidase [Gemmatimonadota bacterium]